VQYRIGIFGGSFDPVHLAHVEAARIARDTLDLDFVYLVPAGNPYHREEVVASSQARLAMCELAAQGHDWLKVSKVDIDRTGNTYTIDMISDLASEFKREFPNDRVEWFLILGADAYQNFPQWKQPQEIAKNVCIVVVSRPGEDHKELELFPCNFIDVPGWEISSTQVRLAVKNNESIAELVTTSVSEYITTNKLYAN
jgi:nicotinate-nucleotide adenylyltransferase